MKNLVKMNLNDYVVFKPTEKAKKIYYEDRQQYLPAQYLAEGAGDLKINEDGFSKMQMHNFMSVFGKHMTMGLDPVIAMDVFIEGSVVKEFKATDWYNISGRGWVCVVNLEEDLYMKDVYGQEVSIDNRIYLVTGVESMGRARAYDSAKGALINKGESIGLLIRGDRNEK